MIFRLPSEAEWEYAARATTKTSRYWQDNPEGEQDAACQYANVFDTKNDSKIRNTYAGISWNPFHCEDEFAFTTPVGQFDANDWKLHDMLGNVWEWIQDCYIDTYKEAPEDGQPRETRGEGDCEYRVLRGGSWDDDPRFVRSSNRDGGTPVDRLYGLGFRLARTL